MTKDLSTKAKRLLELSRLVRHGIPEIEFNMGHFIRSPLPDGTALVQCGTSGCIAGYAVALYEPKSFTRDNECRLEDLAAEILGLSFTESKDLFFARTDGQPFLNEGESLCTIKADHAARVLEHFALTDEIDWSQ